MCSCHAPRNFLKHYFPEDVCNIIVENTRSLHYCISCERLIAKSINSDCKIHCRPAIQCVYCKSKRRSCLQL